MRNEKELRAKSLADKLVKNPHSMADFWKEVRKLNGSPPLALSVNGVSGEINIANMWKEHFSDIMNSVKNSDYKESVLGKFSDGERQFKCFSATEVANAIAELSAGRSCGHDGLGAEHFKHAGTSCAVHLSLCFTMFVRHGILPPSLTDVILTPIVKDKSGKLTEKDNYRPIAVASALR